MKYTPIADEFSDDLKNLLSSILQFDPNNRPKINDLVKRPIIWDKIGDILTQD
jgi:NIMA (never in mitosis gene a)-related kinase 1/4/5